MQLFEISKHNSNYVQSIIVNHRRVEILRKLKAILQLKN